MLFSLPNILHIKETLKTEVMTDLNQLLDGRAHYQTYSPFMTSLGKQEELHAENIFSLFPETQHPECITKIDILKTLSRIYTSKGDGSYVLNYLVDVEDRRIALIDKEDIFPLNKFKNVIEKSLTLIQDSDSELASVLTGSISYILPIHDFLNKAQHRAFSSYRCLGCIFISPANIVNKFPDIDYAIGICHELAHNVLYYYQASDEIIINAGTKNVYSGIRKTFRPDILSFHAAIAAGYMVKISCSFLDKIENNCALDNLVSEEEKNSKILYIKQQISEISEGLSLTLESLYQICQFTPLGSKLMAELSQLLM